MASAYFAVLLALACALASEIAADTGSAVRSSVRLACAACASLACAMLAATMHWTDPMLPRAMALVVLALAPVALGLALMAAWEGPPAPLATVIALSIASFAGLAAAVGPAFVTFAVLFASVCALLALAARHFAENPRAAVPAIAAALSLAAGGAAFLSGKDDAMNALSSFTSAGLVGLSLACALKPARAAPR